MTQSHSGQKTIAVFGATSDIAHAAGRQWAKEGHSFHLFARDLAAMEAIAVDLRSCGAKEIVLTQCDFTQNPELGLGEESSDSGRPEWDIALMAFGAMSPTEDLERDLTAVVNECHLNFTGMIAWSLAVANRMVSCGSGRLAIISSVAGDRGRQSNYIYGAAKAGVSTFCEGLSHRLQGSGVGVTLIKPGMVRTKMTRGLKMPKPLVSSPEKVGKLIVSAIAKARPTVYTPGYWRWILMIIRCLPRFIFERTKL